MGGDRIVNVSDINLFDNQIILSNHTDPEMLALGKNSDVEKNLSILNSS